MALHICRKSRGCQTCEERTRAQVREIRTTIAAAWGQDDSVPVYVTAGLAGRVGERTGAGMWGTHPFGGAR